MPRGERSFGQPYLSPSSRGNGPAAMLGQTSSDSTLVSAMRAARRSSRRLSRDDLRSVSSPRSHTAAPSRPNPLWPELPQRNYAIGPIEPGTSRATRSETPGASSSTSNPWRTVEDLAGEAIDMQELELADLVQQRQQPRPSRERYQEQSDERERDQDWEREQYYIHLSAEARRSAQMHDSRHQHHQPQQPQQQWHGNGLQNDRFYNVSMSPPRAEPTSWSQSQSQAASTSTREAREPRDPQHKVYLLNCKHCGNFLSDRGMKAVLLLKPNITLYSTDAVPTTCGPYYSPSAFHGGVDPMEPPIERTCNCLTQSLGCYGCGNQVGYSILAPCDQCTSSVQKHQRSSNGHRTVLHCSEITVRERRYVPGEPGVRAAPLEHHQGNHRSNASPQAARRRGSPRVHEYTRDAIIDYYGVEEEDEMDGDKTDAAAHAFYQQNTEPVNLRESRQARPNAQSRSSGSNSSGGGCGNHKEARVLRRGDIVYWSDLVAGGERTRPFDPDPILELPPAGR
ncbi:hypothetical protein ACQY0O_007320 [Thecaphora frezii]